MTKVLIVEDNEMNRDMLQRRLERKGYDTVCAISGPEGIQLAESAQPDIILMDVALGEMDGWEATAQILSKDRTRHIPVIALTAHALESDRRQSVEIGRAHVCTPVPNAHLVCRLLLAKKNKTKLTNNQ